MCAIGAVGAATGDIGECCVVSLSAGRVTSISA
jgi:hypothetical protein